MFDRKSFYAQNKRRKDAIVYISPTGNFILTPADFPSEEEFQRWKEWSDSNYHAIEQAGRGFDDALSMNEEIEWIAAKQSAEEEVFSRLEETSHQQLSQDLIAQLMGRLTDKQYYRLWLYYVKHLSEQEIAALEHVGQQRISKSIRSARKIIENFFK